MGFLSFHEKYYTQALDRLEGKTLSTSGLYEAKQLLKLLDDLLDEGYPALYHALEEQHRAVSRLHAILTAHDESPFTVPQKPPSGIRYGDTETPVDAVCTRLSERVQRGVVPSDNPFLPDLAGYCRQIPRRPDTGYVFLLRDAFLPYLCFRFEQNDRLYPWVINRDFLRQTAGKGVDDLLRSPVYEALENGVSDYGGFFAYCKPRIRQVLCKHPALAQTLRDLLGSVREENILVVESGYCGTVPLTLAALDDRVDFRLYTTAPFLYEIYRDKIFCRRYEQIRSFETLFAQDALMRFSSLKNGRFFVQTAIDDGVWDQAAAEFAALQRRGMNGRDS